MCSAGTLAPGLAAADRDRARRLLGVVMAAAVRMMWTGGAGLRLSARSRHGP